MLRMRDDIYIIHNFLPQNLKGGIHMVFAGADNSERDSGIGRLNTANTKTRQWAIVSFQ
jgi:hypothetical protein